MKSIKQAFGPLKPHTIRVIVHDNHKNRLVFEGDLKERWATNVFAICANALNKKARIEA